jgi:hypothetical protein
MTAADGHRVADGSEYDPYDTCSRCGQPIRLDDMGALVTMLSANRECYGER